MPETNGKQATVPYVPFKTFIATLDSFANFLPDQINTSIWTSYSGGIRSQLLSTYKFLGLVNDDGSYSAELKKLADDRDGRPALLRKILERSYVDLLKLDLSKATPSGFDAELRKYGQDGDTHRKVMAFFLGAAKFSGIPLSPLIIRRGGMTVTRRKRTIQGRQKENDPPEDRKPILANPGTAPTRTINLEDGVTLSVTTNVDYFSLNKNNRLFVGKVLDLLDSYGEEEEMEDEDEELQTGTQ